MQDKRIKARIDELNGIFAKLPEAEKILLRNTINSIAFMDIELEDLEEIIANGSASTPDKQLYASTVKTRDSIIKRLTDRLPEDDGDDFDDF